ncbi:MAG: phosphoribosylamine--glycine ligase, partial [Planctomycetia bacterium]
PAPLLTPALAAEVERSILIPTLARLERDKTPFIGVLYAGVMLTATGPKVLEYNVRFGDPECQPLLMRLKSDLADLLLAAATGRLDEASPVWDPRPAVCVVMASGGYPGAFQRGALIRGLEDVSSIRDTKVFLAGAKVEGDRLVTAGGRVLGVTAIGSTMQVARDTAYELCEQIKFTNAHYRRDVGAQALTPPPPPTTTPED